VPGQEWSVGQRIIPLWFPFVKLIVQCHTAEGFLVAHYDLKPPDTRAYGVSGNVLTVHEAFTQLSLGGLANAACSRPSD
jgi:hypothetical protein